MLRIFTTLLACILVLACSTKKVSEKETSAAKDTVKEDPLLEYFKSREIPREELMKEADKRGIPFRKTDHGIIYELHSFDEHTGLPVYRAAGPVTKQYQIRK